MKADLDLISQATIDAGQLAIDVRAKGLKTQRKADGSPVTNGDLAVDAMLKTRLMQARPDYGWLSEETADNPARLQAERTYIVDPIDGTSAYIRGRPWFVVCIAVVEAGRPIAAAIYAPATKELYQAVEGGGAHCNASPIYASGAGSLNGCRMLGDADLLRRQGWPQMQVERRNAIAYRMALVGAGEFDAAVSQGWKHDWDLAAGDLIAREAGAWVSDCQGQRLAFNTPLARNAGLICAAPELAPLILAKTAPIDLSSNA